MASGTFGTLISVTISVSDSADSRNPVKKSSMAISRVPSGPCATTVARSANSADGNVRRGVGVGERAADGAAVAHLVVADVGSGFGQQPGLAEHERVDLDVAVAGHRTDREVVACIADVLEIVQAVDVDEHRRRREAEPHERNERVAAGDELGFVAVFGERGDGLVDRPGPDVVECCGDHVVAPAALSTALTMLW